MFSLRAISMFTCVVLSLLAPVTVCAMQSRMEDRVNKPDTTKKKAAKITKRTAWNLDGGVFFATDGHLENGSCFRLSGQLTAPDFFDGLRRVDTDDGTSYLLRAKTVTEFPDELFITF